MLHERERKRQLIPDRKWSSKYQVRGQTQPDGFPRKSLANLHLLISLLRYIFLTIFLLLPLMFY